MKTANQPINQSTMKPTKNVFIAGVVILGLAASAAAVSMKVNHDAEVAAAAKKEAARIAYENRPQVTEECIMNGFGKGTCSFTNMGKTAGAQCGIIQVQGPGTASSGQFCSGQVAPMSTTKVEFDVPEVNELCDNGFESWTKKCDFSFITS